MPISIRNAPTAKTGLQDMIRYIDSFFKVSMSAIIELGSYVGDSTEIFAKNFHTVYAVDPWQNGYDDKDAASYQYPMVEVEAQFDKLRDAHSNIIKMKMKSSEAAQNLKYRVDVVYIDALHTYEGVKNDIKLFKGKILPGGFLCGHDFQPRFPGVMKAVGELGLKFKTFADTSWAIRL